MKLLGCENLLNHIEKGANLSHFRENLLAVLLWDACASLAWELVVYFLSEICKLLLVNREVIAEVKSSLDWVGKLLELIKSLLICSMSRLLAFTVNPVNSLLKTFHISYTNAFLNILFHRSVSINVILYLVSEWLKLIFDSLKIKDICVFSKPLLLQIKEVLSHLRSESMRLRVNFEGWGSLLVFLTDFKLLFGWLWLFGFLVFHLSVLSWGRCLTWCLSTCWGCICFRGLSWLRGRSHILLNGDLFFLYPLFLKIRRLKDWYLMNIVADSQNEGYFIMFGFALVDVVFGYFEWMPGKNWSSCWIVNEKFHSSFLVIESYCLCWGERTSNREKFLCDCFLFSITTLELISDANGQRVVFLYFVVSDLEKRAKHGSLERAPTSNTLKWVKSAAWLLDTEDFLDLLLD